MQSVVINGEMVERTNEYTYLGDTLDSKLTFMCHVGKQVKKANSRLYFIRTMKKLNVSKDIMIRFYNSSVASVLHYSITSFYGVLSTQLKKLLDQPFRRSRRIIGKTYEKSLYKASVVYEQRARSFVRKIMEDNTHPLHYEYRYLPSGKRLNVPYSRTNRYRNSFIPRSVAFVNM